jgi:hypothetical protein
MNEENHGVARSSAGRSAALRVEPATLSQAEPAATNAGLIALSGDRYSPNLRLWLAKHEKRFGRFWGAPHVYHDKDGVRWIGWIDDDLWFTGCRLMRCLTMGAKAEVGCWTFPVSDLTEEPGFWTLYAAIGRCAIDEGHKGWWLNGQARWREEGDTRHCLWCCNHTQHLRRWTETIERERWEPASVDTRPKDEDPAQTGASLASGAVAKPDARTDPA